VGICERVFARGGAEKGLQNSRSTGKKEGAIYRAIACSTSQSRI